MEDSGWIVFVFLGKYLFFLALSIPAVFWTHKEGMYSFGCYVYPNTHDSRSHMQYVRHGSSRKPKLSTIVLIYFSTLNKYNMTTSELQFLFRVITNIDKRVIFLHVLSEENNQTNIYLYTCVRLRIKFFGDHQGNSRCSSTPDSSVKVSLGCWRSAARTIMTTDLMEYHHPCQVYHTTPSSVMAWCGPL